MLNGAVKSFKACYKITTVLFISIANNRTTVG